MIFFETVHSVLQRMHKLLSSRRAALELTGRAEKEYNRIMADLKEMTPEERMNFFKSKQKNPLVFEKEIDGTTYLVRTFFQSEGNETLLDRAENFVARNL